jgi:hypothetical protein
MKQKLLWLREVLAIAEIGGTLLLPQRDLNTLVQFEEKSNGIGEIPNGGRETG